MREVALVVGTMVFAGFHFLWYVRVVALWLWELSGGIQREGRLAVYGASDWAWTTPVHLPAGLIFVSPLGAVGILPLLAGSLLAGFAATELLLADPNRSISRTGQWRLWLFLLGWAWIPAPTPVSWIYHTDRFLQVGTAGQSGALISASIGHPNNDGPSPDKIGVSCSGTASFRS